MLKLNPERALSTLLGGSCDGSGETKTCWLTIWEACVTSLRNGFNDPGSSYIPLRLVHSRFILGAPQGKVARESLKNQISKD